MDGEEIESWLIKESQARELMTDTPSRELSRADAKRLAEEIAEILGLAEAGQERKYREHMLTSNARMEVKLDALGESFKEHVALDEKRHISVNQEIGNNKSWINKGTGILIAVVALMGVMMWYFDKVRT